MMFVKASSCSFATSRFSSMLVINARRATQIHFTAGLRQSLCLLTIRSPRFMQHHSFLTPYHTYSTILSPEHLSRPTPTTATDLFINPRNKKTIFPNFPSTPTSTNRRHMSATAGISNNPNAPTSDSEAKHTTMSSGSSVNSAESVSSSVPTTPSKTPDFSSILAHHQLKENDLQAICDQLVGLAKEAGAVMVEAEQELLVAAAHKNNSSDLVTKYDKQIEDMVMQRLQAAYPSFDFLGEETFKAGTKLADEPTFICDPIDGTLNFTKGFPNFCISLALALNKKPVVGVVYNPVRGDLYTAIKNQGAYMTTWTGVEHKLPLHTMPPPMPSLRSCLVAIEYGNQRKGPNWELRSSMHKQLLTDTVEGGAFCNSIRSNGSAALDFCYVAQGNLDLFWEGGVYSWDVAAGWIILEEAGGIVASANPGDWDPTVEGRLYLAVRHAKREEQKAVIEQLWEMMGDRKFVF